MELVSINGSNVARLLRGILQSTAKILFYIIAFGFK